MKEVCNFIAILIRRSTGNRSDNFGLYLICRKIENLVRRVHDRDDVYTAPVYYHAGLCTHVHLEGRKGSRLLGGWRGRGGKTKPRTYLAHKGIDKLVFRFVIKPSITISTFCTQLFADGQPALLRSDM